MKYLASVLLCLFAYIIARLISDSFISGWIAGIIVGGINAIILEDEEE